MEIMRGRLATAQEVIDALQKARLIEEPTYRQGGSGLKLTDVGEALVNAHGTSDKAGALSYMTVPGLYVAPDDEPGAVAPPSVRP